MGFPFEIEEVTVVEEPEIAKEFEIDFKTGQLTGATVEGLEAVKAWVFLALKVGRYKHLIYSWDYGTELEDLIGKTYSLEYLNAEIPRLIEETLSLNKYIKGVDNFNIELSNDRISIMFDLDTVYGGGEMQIYV